MVQPLKKINQLPLWPTTLRGMPNAVARSALFNIDHARKGERGWFQAQPIFSAKNIKMIYTGAELRVDDEDVFLQVLHGGRTHDLGTTVEFTARDMMKALKWTLNKESTERLKMCLTRLSATTIEITVKNLDGTGEGFGGSLVRLFRWKNFETGELFRKWQIELEPEIVALFGQQTYTRIDWEFRLSLPPLAKQLHKFYHSHGVPFPMKVQTLYELSGSHMAELRKFRYELKKALALLVERGFFKSFAIDKNSDLVTVIRTSPTLMPPAN
mgnify:CR=1 FL=1